MSLPVHVEHAERLDAVLAQDSLLTGVDVAEADVDELLDVEEVLRLQPAEVLGLLLFGESGDEADGHAVDVARVARLGGVDVGVRVDPDDGDLAVQSLADGLGGPGDGADGDGVVAAEGQDHAALLGVLVDLVAEALGHAADGLGVLHAPEGGVFLRDEVRVRVYRVVAMELVVELVSQLGEETRLDESGGCGVNTGLALQEKSDDEFLFFAL